MGQAPPTTCCSRTRRCSGRSSTPMTVAISATVIPIVIAAFAAYALAWMDFPGRGFLIAVVVGLLRGAIAARLRATDDHPWLDRNRKRASSESGSRHTGFGLPLAVYLLRNYMVGLPRDIIEKRQGRRGHPISRSSSR